MRYYLVVAREVQLLVKLYDLPHPIKCIFFMLVHHLRSSFSFVFFSFLYEFFEQAALVTDSSVYLKRSYAAIFNGEEEESLRAMPVNKPTLVIVHGGWHVPESYKKLVVALERAGYEVHCPRLPSTNQVYVYAVSTIFF